MPRRDDGWLRDLYEAHWSPLVRVAGVLLGATEVAEDLVLDAYVATWRRRARFATPAEAGDYLTTTVLNRTRSAGVAAGADWSDLWDALPSRAREALVLRRLLDADDEQVSEWTQRRDRGLARAERTLDELGVGAESLDEEIDRRAEQVSVSNRFSDLLDRLTEQGEDHPGTRFRRLLAACLAAVLVGAALPLLVPRLMGSAVDTHGPGSPDTVSAQPAGGPASLMTLQRDLPLYYVGEDGLLYRSIRDLPTQSDRLTTAIAAVLNVVPQEPALSSLWSGGQVNSAKVEGTRITIDISGAAFANFTNRQVAEQAINQVVYTATAVVGDRLGRLSVQVLRDGSPNLPVLGAPDADFGRTGNTPLGRLWVLSPRTGVPLASGEVVLEGLQQATVTSTRVAWQVLDADGKVVGEGDATAAGNEVGWRRWRATTRLGPGEYVLSLQTPGWARITRHFTIS